MQQVEVFKTNVNDRDKARIILRQIALILPNASASFDLDDCDRILRIEDTAIDINLLQKIAVESGFECVLLS